MKYVQNLRNKNEQEVLNALGNSDFPLLVGGGEATPKAFIFLEQSELNTIINNNTDIQEAFNITYKPYIINGYDQRISLTNSLGFYSKTYNAYTAGLLTNAPTCYNYSKVSPITFSSTDTAVATVDANSGAVTALTSGTTIIKVSFAGNEKYKPYEAQYTLIIDIPAAVDPEPNYPLHNGHKYVNLGLPSGTMWAAYNIGATAVNEYGDYYFWANVNPVTDTETDNPGVDDVYAVNVSEANVPESYSKYNNTDNKTTLDLTDDAARVNWGGSWQIPSKNDFEELLENTTATYVENYLGRGADGVLLTSNNNANSVFFPYNNNDEWGRFAIMAGELDNYGCPYVLYSGRWWDNKTPEWNDYDASREYSYIYRPIFYSPIFISD